MFDVLDRIRELRENRGWSVYKLAKLSEIPQSTIATWYQKGLYPPIDKIEILCQTFQISLSDFFRDPIDHNSTEAEILIAKWTLLTQEQKQVVLQMISLLLQNNSEIQ